MKDPGFGQRDPGRCDILPPPTRREEIEAALSLYRQHIKDFRYSIAQARTRIEQLHGHIADARRQIRQLERELEELS